MPLIDPNDAPRDNRPKTVEEKQAATKQQLTELTSQAFRQLKAAYARGRRLLRENPFGLTYAQVIAGLGEDAAELDRLSNLLVSTVNDAVPGTIPVE
jgi:hypothetical protein